MDPLVSIIIASYNHSHFIIDTLDSVIADSYQNKEIVIIDDGSKDDSSNVISNWIQNHPDQKVLFSQRPNKGFCATLNELVSKANGKYLIIVASDDLLTNNTITERVKILAESDKMVMISDAEVIDDKGIITHKSMLSGFHKARKENYKTEAGILNEILFNFAISGAVVIMDKRIFSIVGKYPEDLKGEDFYFYISTASANEILFFDKVVSKYRIHANNTSGENPELYIDTLKTYRRLFFKIPGIKRKLKIIKRVLGSTIYSTIDKIKS